MSHSETEKTTTTTSREEEDDSDTDVDEKNPKKSSAHEFVVKGKQAPFPSVPRNAAATFLPSSTPSAAAAAVALSVVVIVVIIILFLAHRCLVIFEASARAGRVRSPGPSRGRAVLFRSNLFSITPSITPLSPSPPPLTPTELLHHIPIKCYNIRANLFDPVRSWKC